MAKRTMYSLYHQVAGQSDFGRLTCFMSQEVAPGDTWSGKIGMLVRLSPLKRALLQDIYVDQFVFYVPHRLIYADWENFIAAGPSDNPSYTLPTHEVTDAGTGEVRHLWYNRSEGHAGSTTYSAMRLYAYNRIFEEYFRDEDATAQGPGLAQHNDGRPVNHKKDYWSNLQAVIGKSQADFSISAAGDTVSAREVLQEIARQKIAMKRATYGTRYVDILKSYGVNVNYQMLQRPELVGISRGQINLTDVVQTAGDSSGGQQTVLGSMAGHGIAGSRMRIRRKSFPEHGTLMGVLCVRPNYTDTNFADYFDSPRAYEAFYDPGLVPLPNVEVTTKDVAPPFAQDVNCGYQPWGQWYRKALSRTHRGLKEWVGTVQPTTPLTNANLKLVNPANYDDLFNETAYGHFQFSAVNAVKAARFLPRSNMSVITGQGG